MRYEFKFGDVLPPDDPVAHWIVKLAMIQNDLVFTNGRLLDATPGTVDFFYWQRWAIAYLHEALNTVAEENEIPEVAAFLASLPDEIRALNAEALRLHSEVVGPMSRVRNEAAFHYPGDQTRRALRAALTDLADRTGSIESASGKVRDSRANYADDVVATLFYRAMGNDDTIMAQTVEKIAFAERSLMRFINYAQDEFFVRAAGGGSN